MVGDKAGKKGGTNRNCAKKVSFVVVYVVVSGVVVSLKLVTAQGLPP